MQKNIDIRCILLLLRNPNYIVIIRKTGIFVDYIQYPNTYADHDKKQWNLPKDVSKWYYFTTRKPNKLLKCLTHS